MIETGAQLIAKTAARAANEKKAENIEVLKMPDIMVDTEYFVICSSATYVQVRAIVDEISTALEKAGAELLRIEGRGNNTWVLLDYGHVVVHVFVEDAYHYYDLNKLWADAQRVPWA